MNILDTADGKVMTDFGNIASLADVKLLVDCVDGLCKQTYGYVKGDGKVFKFIEGEDGGKANDGDTLISNDCSDGVGKFHGDSPSAADGLCVKDNTSITFASDSNIKHVILKNTGNDTPFANTKDDILVKHGLNYAIIDKFDSGNL